jgi:hypothetical protein
MLGVIHSVHYGTARSANSVTTVRANQLPRAVSRAYALPWSTLIKQARVILGSAEAAIAGKFVEAAMTYADHPDTSSRSDRNDNAGLIGKAQAGNGTACIAVRSICIAISLEPAGRQYSGLLRPLAQADELHPQSI